MASTENDFVQPATTVYMGNAPQAGVFYVSRNVPTNYFVATGERMKNGKYVMHMHDVHCGPRKKVVRVGVDSHWFAQLKRAEIVPGRVHALLTAALVK